MLVDKLLTLMEQGYTVEFLPTDTSLMPNSYKTFCIYMDFGSTRVREHLVLDTIADPDKAICWTLDKMHERLHAEVEKYKSLCSAVLHPTSYTPKRKEKGNADD